MAHVRIEDMHPKDQTKERAKLQSKIKRAEKRVDALRSSIRDAEVRVSLIDSARRRRKA